MDEILLLQQQLMAVQNTSTLYKLANRNVMEIIDLLIRKHGLVLFFTTDGREFVTPECLDSMIREIVVENGRVSLGELPNLLNIGASIIEQRVDEVVKKGLIKNINGVLISPTYLDRLAEQVNDELQVANELVIADLAIKFELPTTILMNELTARLSTFINGIVSSDGKRLLTNCYLGIVRARLKGIMKCQMLPKLVSSIAKTYRLDGSALDSDIKVLIEQGGFYIPNTFLAKKDEIIKKTFQDQGFIEFEWLENNFLEKKPKDLLKKLFEDQGLTFLKASAISKKKL